MNEIDFVRRARDGDGDAIRELYRRYAPRVYAVVRRLAADDSLAEDWAQEAWIRAIRALPSFRGEARFSTWLHRIAVNSALHGRRWRERRAKNEIPLPVTLEVRERNDQAVLRIALQRALDSLPDGMRQVIVLRDVYELPHDQIAAELGISESAAKVRLHRARRMLRDRLFPGDQRHAV